MQSTRLNGRNLWSWALDGSERDRMTLVLTFVSLS